MGALAARLHVSEASARERGSRSGACRVGEFRDAIRGREVSRKRAAEAEVGQGTNEALSYRCGRPLFTERGWVVQRYELCGGVGRGSWGLT